MSEASQRAKTIVVDIDIEEGEPLGATPNDKLVIVKVQPGTLADGKLKIGDRVLKVNDRPVQDANAFFQRLLYAPPLARITVLRDEKTAAELESKVNIPPERAKLIQRRDGYTYFLAKLQWQQGGPKLGLGIRHFQNRVLVSRADPGSLAALELQVGDHMLDIDGVPVTDKDVARSLLLKAIQANSHASMVVERPESMEAKHWVQMALQTNPAQPPSVQMNSDTQQIAQRQQAIIKQRLQASNQAKAKGILRSPNAPKHSVKIGDQPVEYVIASDNEGKPLRPVKK